MKKKNVSMVGLENKLLLEEVYRRYVNVEIDSLKSVDEDVSLFEKFRDFRLDISGGSESSMGDIGMGSIEGFIEECVCFDNMMSDSGGCYRGDFSWENREGLFEILDEVISNKEFNSEVKKKYNEWYLEEYGEDYSEE